MKIGLDEGQIAVTIQKLFCYKQLESLNFESINECFNNISDNYKTKNTSKLESLNRQVNNNFKRINEYNETNILILDKNLEKYQTTAREVSQDFRGLV